MYGLSLNGESEDAKSIDESCKVLSKHMEENIAKSGNSCCSLTSVENVPTQNHNVKKQCAGVLQVVAKLLVVKVRQGVGVRQRIAVVLENVVQRVGGEVHAAAEEPASDRDEEVQDFRFGTGFGPVFCEDFPQDWEDEDLSERFEFCGSETTSKQINK